MQHRIVAVLFLLAIFSGLLTGCAATDPGAIRQLGLWQGIRVTASCCSTQQEALSRAKPLSGEVGVLDENAPHFDFGNGLAPFSVFIITETTRVLEVESLAQGLPMSQGGDGVHRYFAADLIFLDGNGREQRGDLVEESQRLSDGRPTGRSLFQYIRVPRGARTLILTTNPKKNKEHHVGLIRVAPSERITSQSQKFFEFRSLMTDGYKSTNYGWVALRELPTE